MDLNKTIKYWIEGSEYDLDTAEELLKVKKYPYALFFAHLALEKLLKSIIVKNTDKHAPITHSLTYLAKKTTVKVPEEILDKLAEFTIFNIEARYPDERRKFYERCSKKFTETKMEEVKEVYKWFQKKLSW